MSTDFLKTHAEKLALFAEETSARAKENPNDLLLQLAAKNQLQAANKAAKDLALAEAEQAGELLELRFLGPKANGSMSLDAFIKIAEPLSQAWKLAATRLRYGVQVSRARQEVTDTLNLKLAGITSGSTRILLTGNGRADLTGENLLHETLIQTFRLLNANNEDFYDSIDAIGGRSASYFGYALKAIDTAGFSTEFSWNTENEKFSWRGLPDDILRIKTLLDTVKEPEVYQETINGTVAGILDTGRLDIRTVEGKITIRYPLKLTEYVQRLSIAKQASIKVETSRYWDAVAKKDIFKRQMLDLGDMDFN